MKNIEKFLISTGVGYITTSLLLSYRGWADDPHKIHGPVVNITGTRKSTSGHFYPTLKDILEGLHHVEIHGPPEESER